MGTSLVKEGSTKESNIAPSRVRLVYYSCQFGPVVLDSLCQAPLTIQKGHNKLNSLFDLKP